MSRTPAFVLIFAATASLAAGPPEPGSGGCGGSYVVARGDTLYSIARRCHSSVVAIAGASRLDDPRRIEIGQRLVIPGPDVPFPSEADKPEPARATEAVLAYNMRPGDTLYSLARWARVGVGALIAANPGIDPHKIEIGDNVRLPSGATPPEPARLRERGTGPGPAFVPPPPPPRVQESRPRPAPAPPPPPPRAHARDDHPPPPASRRDKPDGEDERAPEGM